MSSGSDEETEFICLIAAAATAVAYTDERLAREPWTESHYGGQQTAYFLEREQELYAVFRLNRRTFDLLLVELMDHGLEAARTLTAAERLLHFLYIVGQGSGFRAVKALFRRPLGTISDSFHTVLTALLSLYPAVVREPDYTAIPDRISKNPKFYPYFRDCVGALDGSHIKAHIVGETKPYRNRKGDLSQNVLAVVDFNMLFTYVLAGWEGSAADITVLSYARDMEGFGRNLPKGKYYVADAGYISSDMTMLPFAGGVRYHLKEWLQPMVSATRTGRPQADLRPTDEKELFNLRHSSLRNVVERVFGVLKNRFHILEKRAKYSMHTQIQLVYALVALHNFIGRANANDALFRDEIARMQKDILIPQPEDMFNQQGATGTRQPTVASEAKQEREMDKFCDKIASDMWQDYAHHLITKGQKVREVNEIP